jgi:hypothetical protein
VDNLLVYLQPIVANPPHLVHFKNPILLINSSKNLGIEEYQKLRARILSKKYKSLQKPQRKSKSTTSKSLISIKHQREL